MPKKTTLYIKESSKILRKRLSLSKGKLRSDKIKTLLYIKEERFHYQSEIGKDLERTEKTIRGWIQEYSINGYKGLLKEKRGGNNTRTLSDKAVKEASIYSKLISKLAMVEKYGYSFDYGLSSFIELKLICEKKIGENIEYHALYSHFRRNHKVEFDFLKKYFSKKRRNKKRFLLVKQSKRKRVR